MKLLIISGPTATGKTALAVKLAKKYNGEIISADSRQIFQEINIGVGKDHPKGTPIHLIDIITPKESFSANQYRLIVQKVIYDIHSRGKLPILVGCTGFYIDAIINPRPTFDVKPNPLLRSILDHLPLAFLQLLLGLIDFKTFKLLNNSDKHNPYRLIRKIEVKLSPSIRNFQLNIINYDYLHLSLTAPNSYLYQRIDARVDERIKIGHLDELNSLLKKYSWSDPGLKVSAYSSLRPYIEKKSDLNSCLQKWKYAEHRDARHQKTWFKRLVNVTFYDISRPSQSSKIEKHIDQWYNKS